MFLYFVIAMDLVAAICGFFLKQWQSALLLTALLLLSLVASWSIWGEGVLLVAGYGGAAALIAMGLGHRLGVKLRSVLSRK